MIDAGSRPSSKVQNRILESRFCPYSNPKELEGIPLILDSCNIDSNNPCILHFQWGQTCSLNLGSSKRSCRSLCVSNVISFLLKLGAKYHEKNNQCVSRSEIRPLNGCVFLTDHDTGWFCIH
uniref:Uncharacterized protein n=1 Tax=Oryzias sinensis TaxID=183150 RepID=A0A8C7ZPQ7_9TELE